MQSDQHRLFAHQPAHPYRTRQISARRQEPTTIRSHVFSSTDPSTRGAHPRCRGRSSRRFPVISLPAFTPSGGTLDGTEGSHRGWSIDLRQSASARKVPAIEGGTGYLACAIRASFRCVARELSQALGVQNRAPTRPHRSLRIPYWSVPRFKLRMERSVLSDAQWAKIESHCLGKPTDRGRSEIDKRLFVEEVLWIVRTGSPWRDLRPAFGKRNTVFKRYWDLAKTDIFARQSGALCPAARPAAPTS